jgi:hypothetical protein
MAMSRRPYPAGTVGAMDGRPADGEALERARAGVAARRARVADGG